jgi:SAM-dependent methyltransferase
MARAAKDTTPEGFIPAVCPLCGETRQTGIITARDNNWGYDGLFTYGICAACGTLYENPRPGETALQRYYPPLYGGLPKNLDESTAARIESGVNPRRADAIARHMPGGTLFDVGCGAGLFMECMRRRGWEVAGIDTSADHIRFARGTLGLTAATLGSWPPNRVDPGRYDVVTMFHVLEHMADPCCALGAAFRSLKEGGLLIVETPNTESWPARLFGRNWVTLDAPRHLVLFSLSTLSRALERCGFSRVEFGTWSPSTMEYGESIRYALKELFRSPVQRPVVISDLPGADGGTPARRPLLQIVIDRLHTMEQSLYTGLNRIADLNNVGCNLFAIYRRGK